MRPLEEIFAEILDVPASDLSDTSSPASVPSWDSMANISLVAAIEDAYDLQLSPDDVRDLVTLGDVRRVLRERGASV